MKNFRVKALEKRWEELDEVISCLSQAEQLIHYGQSNDKKTAKKIEKIKKELKEERDKIAGEIIELETTNNEVI